MRRDVGVKRTPKKPKTKSYFLPRGPRGDAPQTRKQDFKRANTYKRTPAYKGAIKAAYKAQPVATRRTQVQRIAAKPAARRTVEEKAILDTHIKRGRRDRSAMSSQIMNDRQRAVIDAFKRTPSYTQALAAARAKRGKVDVDYIHETNPKVLEAAGFKPEGTVDKLMKAPIGALVSGVALADAAYHDPVGVPSKTAKQLVNALPAIPGGLYDLATHPAKTISAEAKAFGNRSSQKFDARVKTIRKRGGLDYAGDAAAVLGAGGAASRLLRVGKDSLRAGVRVSGGTVHVPKQRSLAAEAIGSYRDARRAGKHEKRLRVAEAGGKPIDVLEHQAATANREAGRVVETVARRAGHKQRRLVAEERGRGIYGFRADKGRRLNADAKAINKLDKNEKRAFYYADTLGIRTPEQAAHVLPKLDKLIRDTRARDGIQVTGSLKKSDMLPDIEKILADPEAHFTPKLGDTVEALRADSMRAAHEDPTLHPFVERRRRYAPLAAVLGLEKGVAHEMPSPEGAVPSLRYIDEDDAAFVDRVAKHAKDLGLAEPLYFKSERYIGPSDYAPHALGGLHASKRGPAYTGTNLAHGLQDTRPSMYLLGKAQNIKRKHNWNMVADILDANAVKTLTPHEHGGTTVSALRERMARSGIDMNSVALWNPGVYRQLAHNATDAEEHFGAPEEFDQANISAAMAHSVIRLHDGHVVDGTGLPVDEAKLRESTGWHVVPEPVLKELEAQMVPSGKPGRAWDIAKGKASRAILLTGNVPWLGFQVASNAAMAVAATGGRILNPANWLGAARWWHQLSPEERDRVGAHLGLDATGADSHQIKLGATTNNDLVNTYRAIKAHPIFHTGIVAGHGPSISELNPLELMARADRTNNNIFRIAAGYSLAKRDAIRRMGESMGAADKAQLKLTSIMAKPPAEQLKALAADKQVLEDHANAVADWMGDYTTMTAAERKVINRMAMFYPYLRYSLRLMFYTMPLKHPAVSAVLAEMGQMRANELQKLFGKNGLPFNLGKIYFGSDGHVTSIDLKRANPALNSIIDAASNRNPEQLVGVAPPWAGWLFDQLTQSSSFTGKDWKVHGKAAPYGGPHLPLFDSTRARILADDILGMTFPYREGEKLTQRGPQGDDSMLFSERRIHYKGTTAEAKLQRKFGERRTNFQQDNESLIHDLIPLLPQPDRAPQQAREDKILARAMPKPGAKKSKAKYFGGGSGGSGYFGAKP